MPHVVHGAYVDDGLAGDHLGVEGGQLVHIQACEVLQVNNIIL